MSDDTLNLIPEDPCYVPDPAARKAALEYLREVTPRAMEHQETISDKPLFYCAYSSFESVACKSCKAPVEMDFWQDWMNHDIEAGGPGFDLSIRSLPCCGFEGTLHDLAYHMPQGFGCYSVEARNWFTGPISEETVKRFEEILSCPLRVIYAHI